MKRKPDSARLTASDMVALYKATNRHHVRALTKIEQQSVLHRLDVQSAGNAMVDRLAELGERLRVIEGDIDKIQKAIGSVVTIIRDWRANIQPMTATEILKRQAG